MAAEQIALIPKLFRDDSGRAVEAPSLSIKYDGRRFRTVFSGGINQQIKQPVIVVALKTKLLRHFTPHFPVEKQH